MTFATAENALHLTGVAITGLAAHTAVTYLQTYSPDYTTALGFSAAISASVFLGWTYTLKSRSLWRGIPLAIASLLMTAVSGYTVYQAGVLPLQHAAIESAAQADKPRKAQHDSDTARYNAAFANLQKSIDDLRQQNQQASEDKAAVTGKSADWKKRQLQTAIDQRNSEITTFIQKQAALTHSGEFEPTAPAAMPHEQTRPILARAFALELIAIMFMFFASFAREDKNHRKSNEAAQLEPLVKQAEQLTAQLGNLFRHAEKCRNDVGMDVGIASECTQEEKSPEHLLFLLKNHLIKPNINGNFTTAFIMEKAAIGERKATQLADEWCAQGILERIKSGRGYTYRYPEPKQPALTLTEQPNNVIQLTARSA